MMIATIIIKMNDEEIILVVLVPVLELVDSPVGKVVGGIVVPPIGGFVIGGFMSGGTDVSTGITGTSGGAAEFCWHVAWMVESSFSAWIWLRSIFWLQTLTVQFGFPWDAKSK